MSEAPGFRPDDQPDYPVNAGPQPNGLPQEYRGDAGIFPTQDPDAESGQGEAAQTELPATREQVATEIVETARGIFDEHVEATVATIGNKLQLHVHPTIERVVGTAKETVAATTELREQTTQLQEAANEVRATVSDAENRIGEAESRVSETVAQVDERLDQAKTHVTEVDERLRARTDEVEELVRAGDRRLAVLESASREEVIAAIRELKAGTEPERRLATKLELEAQPTHVHQPLLEAGIQANVPIWLHGQAGSGKSTAAELAADRHDLPFRFIQTNPTTSEAKMMGYNDATSNYRRTGLREVVEHGGVFLFDEIDNGTPAALTTVNSLLANGHGEFPDALIKKHADTRFVAAANTIGKGATAEYVGRNRIDAATIDRFAFVPWDVDRGLTRAIVLGEPSSTPPIDISEGGIPTREEWLDVTESAEDAIGALGIKHLVTPRAALYGAALAEVGVGRKWLSEMTIFKGMNQKEREKIENRMGTSRGW